MRGHRGVRIDHFSPDVDLSVAQSACSTPILETITASSAPATHSGIGRCPAAHRRTSPPLAGAWIETSQTSLAILFQRADRGGDAPRLMVHPSSRGGGKLKVSLAFPMSPHHAREFSVCRSR